MVATSVNQSSNEIYHPPKSRYPEDDLIDYVIKIRKDFIENHPNGLVICGGDLKFINLTNIEVLVDFPTRGNSVLDNCLTNNKSLFLQMLWYLN